MKPKKINEIILYLSAVRIFLSLEKLPVVSLEEGTYSSFFYSRKLLESLWECDDYKQHRKREKEKVENSSEKGSICLLLLLSLTSISAGLLWTFPRLFFSSNFFYLILNADLSFISISVQSSCTN
jgi:hypothetical protein